MNATFSWFGIDFGTTNSAAYSFTGVSKNTLKGIHYGDDEGRPMPSLVAINRETGEVITGRAAKEKRNSLIQTHEYFSSIKTIIDSDKTWEIAGKTWTAEEVAAEVFLALKKRIERDGDNNNISEAVVAVPIGISPAKKKHLRNAAQKAGITIKLFISEPTAAYCSNYVKLKTCKHVAVFDWGGGTLDVAILRIENGGIEELSTNGLQFAGDDIDKKMAQKMHSQFMRGKASSISYDELDPATKDQLLMKCEKAKCEFEDEDVVSISINRYGSYGAVRESMDYNFFELLLEHDVNNATDCLATAIKNAGLNIANIDTILCVGGSSRLRPLQDKLTAIYGEDLLYYPDRVMWDIAKGAAITSTRTGGYTLNKSIGMLLSDESYYPLIPKGQSIPCDEVSLTLGIVQQETDGCGEARLVLTDSEQEDTREFTHNFTVPLRGFLDETVRLSCYVDKDNIFRLKVGSNRMLSDAFRVWTYDQLKVSFSIEGG